MAGSLTILLVRLLRHDRRIEPVFIWLLRQKCIRYKGNRREWGPCDPNRLERRASRTRRVHRDLSSDLSELSLDTEGEDSDSDTVVGSPSGHSRANYDGELPQSRVGHAFRYNTRAKSKTYGASLLREQDPSHLVVVLKVPGAKLQALVEAQQHGEVNAAVLAPPSLPDRLTSSTKRPAPDVPEHGRSTRRVRLDPGLENAPASEETLLPANEETPQEDTLYPHDPTPLLRAGGPSAPISRHAPSPPEALQSLVSPIPTQSELPVRDLIADAISEPQSAVYSRPDDRLGYHRGSLEESDTTRTARQEVVEPGTIDDVDGFQVTRCQKVDHPNPDWSRAVSEIPHHIRNTSHNNASTRLMSKPQSRASLQQEGLARRELLQPQAQSLQDSSMSDLDFPHVNDDDGTATEQEDTLKIRLARTVLSLNSRIEGSRRVAAPAAALAGCGNAMQVRDAFLKWATRSVGKEALAKAEELQIDLLQIGVEGETVDERLYLITLNDLEVFDFAWQGVVNDLMGFAYTGMERFRLMVTVLMEGEE